MIRRKVIKNPKQKNTHTRNQSLPIATSNDKCLTIAGIVRKPQVIVCKVDQWTAQEPVIKPLKNLPGLNKQLTSIDRSTAHLSQRSLIRHNKRLSHPGAYQN